MIKLYDESTISSLFAKLKEDKEKLSACSSLPQSPSRRCP